MNINPEVKRILCYGDSNTWGWVPSSNGQKRFTVNERWPGVLQQLLGDNFEVIEEGLGGRTTMTDDDRPGFEGRNGLESLPLILESHLPLDLVIIMLGTTETKEMMDMSSQDITKGLKKNIDFIKGYRSLENGGSPEILVIAPAVIDETTDFASKIFKGGTEKSRKLIENYRELCKRESVMYLDSNEFVRVDEQEGIHLDKNNHEKLAKAIYNKIK